MLPMEMLDLILSYNHSSGEVKLLIEYINNQYSDFIEYIKQNISKFNTVDHFTVISKLLGTKFNTINHFISFSEMLGIKHALCLFAQFEYTIQQYKKTPYYLDKTVYPGYNVSVLAIYLCQQYNITEDELVDGCNGDNNKDTVYGLADMLLGIINGKMFKYDYYYLSNVSQQHKLDKCSIPSKTTINIKIINMCTELLQLFGCTIYEYNRGHGVRLSKIMLIISMPQNTLDKYGRDVYKREQCRRKHAITDMYCAYRKLYCVDGRIITNSKQC